MARYVELRWQAGKDPIVKRYLSPAVLPEQPSPQLKEPAWAGDLDDDEVHYIQTMLLADPRLARRWGFRPGQKTRSEEAIRRVAMWGDPDSVAHNRALAHPRKARTAEDLSASEAKSLTVEAWSDVAYVGRRLVNKMQSMAVTNAYRIFTRGAGVQAG
jgi:hypothetical protein